MNSVLTTLIDIVRLSAVCNKSQDQLKIAPVRAILADIYTPYLPEEQIERLADELSACAEDRSAALPSLDAIEPALAGAGLGAKLTRASLALNELLALHHALCAGTDRLGRLAISGAHFFDYLQELYIDGGPGQPKLVLIGAGLLAQDEIKIRLDTNNRLLKRIEIAYAGQSPHPLLTLKLWSGSTGIGAQAERFDWYQKDGSNYDLNLWSRFDETCKGEIRTRLVTPPYPIDGGHISIRLGSIAELELRETCVVDGQGNSLVTCLRAVRHATL